MKFNIQSLKPTDYEDILVGRWKDWRWTPPVKDFLPDDGQGGYMVYDGNTPVCAGFMYITNSKVVWCEWIISNFHYKDREKRKQALDLLIDTITFVAKGLDKKYVYTLTKNNSLKQAFKDFGYVEASSYTTELIKKL